MGEYSRFIDITGQTFYELTAIQCIDSKNRIWQWKCSCGMICEARKNDVTSGRKKSCGHLSNRGNATINIGDKFGEWTVLEYIGNRHYICRCSCGVEKSVHSYDLRKGKSKSCGHSSKGTGTNGRKNMTGQQIGEWTIGDYIGNGLYECKCSCGKIKHLMGTYLRTGQSKSCGHMSNQFKDITGQQFGEWTVLKYLGKYSWECQCSCGNIRSISSYDLTHSKSTNCGHMRTPTHLINKRFNRLTVVEYSTYHKRWMCKCDCGNTTFASEYSLVNGIIKSCGCLKNIKEKELLESILHLTNTYIQSNAQLPFPEDIAIGLNITPTTVRKYAQKYGFTDKFNAHFGSIAERDIYNFCKQYAEDVESRNRTVIAPLELDIYIPSKKLAIEFNGDHWHSSEMLDKKYHQQKSIECAKKGIQLIHIFEYEWNDLNKQIKLEQLLKSKFVAPNNVIYARNTDLRAVSDEESREFLNAYHLQGYAPARVNLGLYKDEKLVSLITFGHPRFNNNYSYEIIRYCKHPDYSVIGGIEKLFKQFKDTYKPDSIITYVDFSKFTGNIYTHIGFKYIKQDPVTEPNYVWINEITGDVLTRYKTQKQKLLKLGLGTEDQSEKEIMETNGYIQVFDCGNIKLEWKNY